MTINELAAKHGVSYQAIHKHLKELKTEEAYKNSYRKKGHQTELDDDLVEAIEARMELPEKVILTDAVNEELEAQNKQLTEVNGYQKLIIQLQQEKAVLLEQASQYLALQASNEDLKLRLEDAEARAYNAELSADIQANAAAEAQARTSEAVERAKKAEADLSAASDKNIELQTELRLQKEETRKAWATKDRFEAELEKAAELNKTLQAQADEQAAELEALKKRGFWARLFNKE